MSSIRDILLFILDIAWWIVIVQAILSWLVAFDVLNTRQALVGQIWRSLNALTEPVYRPIRRRMPDLGGVDVSPLIVLIAIFALQVVIGRNL